MRAATARVSLLALLISLLSITWFPNHANAAYYGVNKCMQNIDSTTATVSLASNNADCIIQFTQVGQMTWTVPFDMTARYLMVGGGASGSRGICGIYWGQGGGGGQVLKSTSLSLKAGDTITVNVGAGGAISGSCASGTGNNGSSTTFISNRFSQLTANGGQKSANVTAGNAGATGGTSGSGNVGGTGRASGSNCTSYNCEAGGGGDAGAAGSGVNGGAGIFDDITDSNTEYGGGGAGWSGGTYTTGTASGGGAVPGSSPSCNGTNNRGGGGADCATPDTGGSGGSGFAVIRFPALSSSSIINVSIAGTVKKLSTVTITATANLPGNITFYYSGRPINRCTNLPTNSQNQAACSWKLITTGQSGISARITPTDVGYSSNTSSLTLVNIGKRTISR